MGSTRGRTKMAARLLLFCCCTGVFMQMATGQPTTPSNYQDLYETQWSGDHIDVLNNGAQVNLRLDSSSGAGFQSLSAYTFGFFSMNMQLVPGYSAGTVGTFFITSGGDAHDEIDFEFLGNISGQPYSLQTNLYASGVGEREQRVDLWFDPTAAFHTYSIIWNHAQIIWLVDNTVIRVFKNLQNLGLAYPSSQQTQAITSLFDGSGWATTGPDGGRVPVDYSYAPFIVSYSGFEIDACVNDGVSIPECQTNYQNNWWEGPQYTSLNASQIADFQNMYQTYVVYDYCTDAARFPTQPVECPYNYSP